VVKLLFLLIPYQEDIMEDLRYFTDTLNSAREESFYLIEEGYVDAALNQYHMVMDFIAWELNVAENDEDISKIPEDQLQTLRNICSMDIADIKAASEDVPEHVKARVCQSAAGYYIGTFHPQEGPYDRYSEYYGTHEEAEDRLKNHTWIPRM
jgi:hypothetical protein